MFKLCFTICVKYTTAWSCLTYILYYYCLLHYMISGVNNLSYSTYLFTQITLPCWMLPLAPELVSSTWTTLPVLARSQLWPTALTTHTLLTVFTLKMLVCAAVAPVSNTVYNQSSWKFSFNESSSDETQTLHWFCIVFIICNQLCTNVYFVAIILFPYCHQASVRMETLG